jgi:hypothetical protein
MFAYTKIIQGIQAVTTAVTDAYFNLVTLLLNTTSTNGAQNNTFLDSSSNNFTITRNGNTTQGTFTPFSQTGWGNYFDGSSWISVPDSTDLDLASGTSWTMEAWVYSTGGSGVQNIMGSQTSAGDVNFLIGLGASNELRVVWSSSTPTAYTVSAPTAVTRNTWIHVAAVNNAGTLSLYVNGTSVGTPQSISGTFRNLSSVVSVGRSGNYAGQYWVGYISNARIVNGTAVYTSNFTPSTIPLTDVTNTKLLTSQSNRFIDTNTQVLAKTVTVGGTPSIQAFSPFAPTAAYSTTTVGGSGYFDGTGDSLTRAFTSTTDGMYLQGSTYTMEAWVYPLALSGTQYIYICNAANVASYGYNALYLSGTSAAFATRVATSGTEYSRSGGTVTNNQWFHIAVSVSSNVAKLFLNGTQIGADLTVAANTFTPTGAGIGQNQNGAAGGTNFNGYISNLRITQGAALYTGSFTPSTTPLTTSPPSGTASFLLSGTNAGIYDAASKNVLETVGNAQVSTTQAKFGTTSMYFDGTGDYLLSPSSQNFSLTGDFTIEGWVYRGATGSFRLLTIGDSFAATGLEIYATGPSTGNWVVYSGNATRITGAAATRGVWTYLALVRSGSTVTFYVDGTASGSTWTSSSAFSGACYVAAEVYNSAIASDTFGYIDELRITKYARTITASPTAAFPVQ